MNQERVMQVILSPHVSDKAYRVGEENNQVLLKVARTATKLEIKKAVEQLFDVKVKSVNTLNVKGKERRFGKTVGRTQTWKKAYVSLQEGYDISFGESE